MTKVIPRIMMIMMTIMGIITMKMTMITAHNSDYDNDGQLNNNRGNSSMNTDNGGDNRLIIVAIRNS